MKNLYIHICYGSLQGHAGQGFSLIVGRIAIEGVKVYDVYETKGW